MTGYFPVTLNIGENMEEKVICSVCGGNGYKTIDEEIHQCSNCQSQGVVTNDGHPTKV